MSLQNLCAFQLLNIVYIDNIEILSHKCLSLLQTSVVRKDVTWMVESIFTRTCFCNSYFLVGLGLQHCFNPVTLYASGTLEMWYCICI